MKPTVIDPKTTSRAEAYELWMNAPNPMVTFFKTLDVTPLFRLSRRRNLKFNMLLCWCIGKAASGVKEFYTLPVGRELLQYESIAVNTIVKNKTGEVSSCDVPFNTSLAQFNTDYLRLTHLNGTTPVSFSCTPPRALFSRKQGRFLTFTSQNPKSDNSLSGGIFQVQIKAISFCLARQLCNFFCSNNRLFREQQL
ncbi:CatA-like O-acetyltransferase [Hornefia porci]|uniref:CatA-like O-acetyltransferase n=1 Tax=Hornefia porci TaxID=2652292 RepID=UPI001FE8BA40|nr:hypothetical protein [Hornefia porci]